MMSNHMVTDDENMTFEDSRSLPTPLSTDATHLGQSSKRHVLQPGMFPGLEEAQYQDGIEAADQVQFDPSWNGSHVFDGFPPSAIDLESPWNYDFSVIDWIMVDQAAMEQFGLLMNQHTPTDMTMQHHHPDLRLPSIDMSDAYRQSLVFGDQRQHGSQPLSANNPSDHENSRANTTISQNHRSTEPTPERKHDTSKTSAEWPIDWNPTKQDNFITFPDIKGLPSDVLDAEDLAHVNSISPQCYALIEGCLQRHKGGSPLFRRFAQAELPSLRAMNGFIQLYFEFFQPTFPMLHQGTFDPAYEPWQLVLAVAAIGCRYSKLPASAELAKALQELLRRALVESVRNIASTARI
jgi:hypothetical protein